MRPVSFTRTGPEDGTLGCRVARDAAALPFEWRAGGSEQDLRFLLLQARMLRPIRCASFVPPFASILVLDARSRSFRDPRNEIGHRL